jgi:hypothetical protein
VLSRYVADPAAAALNAEFDLSRKHEYGCFFGCTSSCLSAIRSSLDGICSHFIANARENPVLAYGSAAALALLQALEWLLIIGLSVELRSLSLLLGGLLLSKSASG